VLVTLVVAGVQVAIANPPAPVLQQAISFPTPCNEQQVKLSDLQDDGWRIEGYWKGRTDVDGKIVDGCTVTAFPPHPPAMSIPRIGGF
jgi:hypothetical protein